MWILVVALYDVRFQPWRWRFFVLAGVLAPGIGRFCSYEGIARLGANIAPITNSNPVVSMAIAVLLVGEHLTTAGLVGALLVIAGGIVLASGTNDGADVDELNVKRKYLVFPALAALFYGSAHVVRDAGVELVPSPVVGAAVNITTSWLLVVGYFALTGRFRDARVTPTELVPLVLAGVASSLALSSLYFTLMVGKIVVVAPVLNSSPLFVLLLTYLLLPDRELFSPRIVGGGVVIVAGVALLTGLG